MTGVQTCALPISDCKDLQTERIPELAGGDWENGRRAGRFTIDDLRLTIACTLFTNTPAACSPVLLSTAQMLRIFCQRQKMRGEDSLLRKTSYGGQAAPSIAKFLKVGILF